LDHAMRAIAALVAVALVLTPAAHADPPPGNPDQGYLNMIRANGIDGGDDDTLIDYAHQFCTINGHLPAWDALRGQGITNWQAFFTIQTAASRFYCPDRVPNAHAPTPPHWLPGPW
jgi:hypothetical protein